MDSRLHLPPDNFSLNPANNRTDQSLSDFQTDIGVATHASLDTEQHISCTRAALLDTVASMMGSGGWIISVSEVHKPLITSHYILDSALPKQVGSEACILVFLFNSTSRQDCEVWTLQLPFLHNLRPSEACLYGFINWSLAQN